MFAQQWSLMWNSYSPELHPVRHVIRHWTVVLAFVRISQNSENGNTVFNKVSHSIDVTVSSGINEAVCKEAAQNPL